MLLCYVIDCIMSLPPRQSYSKQDDPTSHRYIKSQCIHLIYPVMQLLNIFTIATKSSCHFGVYLCLLCLTCLFAFSSTRLTYIKMTMLPTTTDIKVMNSSMNVIFPQNNWTQSDDFVCSKVYRHRINNEKSLF